MDNTTSLVGTSPRTTLTDHEDECNNCETDLTKAELPVVLVFSIILNTFAVVVLIKIRNTCQGIDLMMVLTLAANDLVTSVLFTIMWIGGWIKCGCMMSYHACALLGWLASSMVIWSAWVIIIMSACRYLATVKPLYFRANVTYSSIHVALVVTLVMTLVSLTFPFFDIAAKYEYYTDNKICAYDFTPSHGNQAHRIILGVLSTEGALATLVVLYFNVCIVYKLRRKNTVHSETSSVLPIDNNKSKRTAFANVTKVVSAVYCLCYGPFLVRLLYDVIINAPDQDQLYHSITMTLLFMSPLLNPMVYVACNRRYRDFIISNIKSCWLKLSGRKDRNSRTSMDVFSMATPVTSNNRS